MKKHLMMIALLIVVGAAGYLLNRDSFTPRINKEVETFCTAKKLKPEVCDDLKKNARELAKNGMEKCPDALSRSQCEDQMMKVIMKGMKQGIERSERIKKREERREKRRKKREKR